MYRTNNTIAEQTSKVIYEIGNFKIRTFNANRLEITYTENGVEERICKYDKNDIGINELVADLCEFALNGKRGKTKVKAEIIIAIEQFR